MNPQKYNKNRLRAAFTLVELLTVITVIAILAAIGSAVYSGVQRKAAWKQSEAFFALIESGLEQYRADYGEYPVPKDAKLDDSQRGGTVLYQALTGDGVNMLKFGSSSNNTLTKNGCKKGTQSTGKPGKCGNIYIEGVSTQSNAYANLITLGTSGKSFTYYLNDAFGSKANYLYGNGENDSKGALRNIHTYDLWFVMNDATGTLESAWIKNW